MVQGIVGREKRRRDRRCRLHRHRAWQVCGGTFAGRHPAPEAGPTKGEHTVPDREAPHIGSCRADNASAFQAQRSTCEPGFHGLVGQHSECIHHVAEVEAGGLHLDAQIEWAQFGQGAGFPAQVAQLPGKRDPQPDVLTEDILC